MIQTIRMAFRNLGRNRRRSFFSSLALGIGLALLLLMAGFVNGEMTNAMELSVKLYSGHLQVRADSYDESKSSLKWEDLIENPDQAAAQIATLAPVTLATPRLYATGILSVGDETTGVRVVGIDPQSEANAPYRDGLVTGQFISADDREGILIGQPLAENLNLESGDKVNLTVNTSSGGLDEQPFTIRGIYSTDTNGFDSATVFLPLAKAQTMTQTENHASTIFIMLKDMYQADSVAEAIQTAQGKVLTWEEMNDIIVQTENLANSYIYLLYLIVLAITATVIVNTLVMAVFERTREIGILAAIGMKRGRIMGMFLAESSLLAVGGIVMGLILGFISNLYFTQIGFYIGKMGITGMLIGNTIYAKLTLQDTITLTILAFVVTLLAGLYPAFLAARMEPVQALHGGEKG